MYAEKQTADFTYRAACDFIDMLVLGECISRCILRQLVFYYFLASDVCGWSSPSVM